MANPFDGLASVFTSALGETVTVTPDGGQARAIGAIFVRRLMDDAGIIIQGPAIHAAMADVADLRDGDAVSVGGASYVAREFRPDGRGMVTVVMEAA